jgi:CRP-like cAMP-binding protein
MRRAQFQAGQRIFSQGDRSDGAYLVIVGAVEISAERNGRSFHLSSIPPGGIFGEMGLIEQAPRSATATAETDTTCAVYDSDELTGLIRSDPEEVLRIMRTLIHRLRDTDRKYSELLDLLEPRTNGARA